MKAWRTTISDDTKNSALARDCSNAKRYCEISLGLSTPKFFLVCYMLVPVEREVGLCAGALTSSSSMEVMAAK